MARPRPRRGLGIGWKLLALAAAWPVGALALLLIVSPFATTSGPGGNESAVISATFALSFLVALGVLVHVVRAHYAGPRAATPPSPDPDAPPSKRYPASRSLAILMADIEGYAAVTAASSRQQLVSLLDDARRLVLAAVAPRGGRLVKTVGDAFLVAFESPTEAVLAGRDVLAAAAARQLRMRVGVASGEVTLHRDDVFGDAVNLAARLQAAAPTDRVYFSESTYHAMIRSEVPHEEVGVVELKNVGPARVFRTRPGPAPDGAAYAGPGA
jgi:class 3 adenylate cyclase